MRPPAITLACLLVVPCASPAATRDTAVVFGIVRTPEGRPVSNVTLVVEGPSGTMSVVTDRNGEYRVENLKPGDYVVTPLREGRAVQAERVTLEAGTARVLDFSLPAGEAAPATALPAPETPRAASPLARSEAGAVQGTVRAPDGAVLPGATVAIEGTAVLTRTDGVGVYELRGLRPGSVVFLHASLHGFGDQTASVLVRSGQTATCDFTLPLARITEEITVEAEIPLLKAADQVSQLELSPFQIAALPSLGEKDIFRAFQLLPGISGSNETSSGLYVRGGTPDQNLTSYDGFTLYDVDHLFGYFSAFNMEAVEQVRLSKGAFDAKYGGRLSSVMELVGKTGDTEERHGSIGASLLSVNGLYEQPLPGNGSLLVAARRSFQGPLYDKILGLFDDNPGASGPAMGRGGGPGGGLAAFGTQPSSYFYDLNAKLSFQSASSGGFAIGFYDGKDDLDNSRDLQLPSFVLERLAERGIEVEGDLSISDLQKWGNRGVAGVWSRSWTDSFQTQVSLGYSRFFSQRDRTSQADVFRPPDEGEDPEGPQPRGNRLGGVEDNRLEDVTLHLHNSLKLHWSNQLEFGVQITTNDIRYGYDLDSGDDETDEPAADEPRGLLAVLDRDQQGRQSSFYVQDRWTLFDRLTLVPGIRATQFDVTDESFLEPRASLTLHATEHLKLKGAWGRQHQFANRVTREDVMQGSREFWTLSDGETVATAAAEHLVAGASYETSDFLANLELFHTDLSGLTEFVLRFGPRMQDQEVDYDQFFYTGTGRARGLEFLLQKKFGDHTGWLSYTLSKVEHEFPEIQEAPFPALHDQTHELKLVDSWRLGDWTFSGTWIYATGKPYTEPVGIEAVDLPNGMTIDQVVVGEKNGGRLPSYHRLDLSVSYDVDLDWARGTIGATLFNAYNRRNVWYKEFESVEGEIIENDIELMGRTVNLFLSVRF